MADCTENTKLAGWEPIASVAELDQLDDAEIQEGYFDGRDDAPEPRPGGNRSRSYWHGWRIGMMDSGRIKIDAGHRQLVAEYMKRERAKLLEKLEVAGVQI